MNIATNPADFQPQPVTRRSILRGIPAAAALSVTASAAVAFQGPPPAQPDPLPGWFREWREKRAALRQMADPDSPEGDVIVNAMDALEDRLIYTKARTHEGAAAQIEFLVENGDAGDAWSDGRDGRMLNGIVEMLKGRAV